MKHFFNMDFGCIQPIGGGTVKSVNNVFPDENGNVQINVPEVAQSNWNASEDEQGHVLNRTHWVEQAEVPLAENKTVTKVNFTTVSWMTYDKMKDCTTARVIFDGVEYVCPVTVRIDFTEYGDESYFYIGNFQDGSPEYPFCFWGYISNYFAIVNVKDGTHTVSVYVTKEVVHPFDEKFLPESVSGVIIRSSTVGSNKKFKLTVDDDGTISAKEI